MRLPTDDLHPALRGLFGLVTAGLMVLIGAILLEDGVGPRRYVAWLFFALAGYRAYEALKEVVQGLRPPLEDDEDE